MVRKGEAMSTDQALEGMAVWLNKAVARELQVSIQYMLQHAIVGGAVASTAIHQDSKPGQRKFAGSHAPVWLPGTTLKKIAITEMRHAEAVAERVVALGGRPTVKPAPVTTGDTPAEMIATDRQAEEAAIQLYRQIIEAADEASDETTGKLFRRILADEENHLRTFAGLLDGA